MTVGPHFSENGDQYVKLSRQDYYKLTGLGLTFFTLVMAGTVALSGILVHIGDDQRHQTPEEKRRQIEAVVDMAVERMKQYVDVKLELHEKGHEK